MGERTGSRVLQYLWSYVEERVRKTVDEGSSEWLLLLPASRRRISGWGRCRWVVVTLLGHRLWRISRAYIDWLQSWHKVLVVSVMVLVDKIPLTPASVTLSPLNMHRW
ncbi:hypothetical protein CONLIGDRAFT_275447 [Coniochaeta ligniaria NRRL 30616]|uniref:Uncharacterized protein n=1 Tax=Coniochaeta ligniaria NRRL 30616 TaxID=1408157 RepID=A0A1J7JXU4_9PEZI|nr:hypothetical protein CONLIGDRAFT_275447 [Coniochaeta ligniaria NRRL 30616]